MVSKIVWLSFYFKKKNLCTYVIKNRFLNKRRGRVNFAFYHMGQMLLKTMWKLVQSAKRV